MWFCILVYHRLCSFHLYIYCVHTCIISMCRIWILYDLGQIETFFVCMPCSCIVGLGLELRVFLVFQPRPSCSGWILVSLSSHPHIISLETANAQWNLRTTHAADSRGILRGNRMESQLRWLTFHNIVPSHNDIRWYKQSKFLQWVIYYRRWCSVSAWDIFILAHDAVLSSTGPNTIVIYEMYGTGRNVYWKFLQ